MASKKCSKQLVAKNMRVVGAVENKQNKENVYRKRISSVGEYTQKSLLQRQNSDRPLNAEQCPRVVFKDVGNIIDLTESFDGRENRYTTGQIATPERPRIKRSIKKLRKRSTNTSSDAIANIKIPENITVRNKAYENQAELSSTFINENLDFEPVAGPSNASSIEFETVTKQKLNEVFDAHLPECGNKLAIDSNSEKTYVKESNVGSNQLEFPYFENLIFDYFINEYATLTVIKRSERLSRRIAVNALIACFAHNDGNSSIDVLIKAVILFDRAVSKLNIPWNTMQLAGLACYRLVYKYENATSDLAWKKIIRHHGWNMRELNRIEQNILKVINFDFNFPEPSVFIVYYLENLNIIYQKKLLYCVYYILTCFLLNDDFPLYTPSIIAAAAVNLALEIFEPQTSMWVNMIGKIGYYTFAELSLIKKEMCKIIIKMCEENQTQRAPFHAFSTAKYLCISAKIRDRYINNIKKVLP